MKPVEVSNCPFCGSLNLGVVVAEITLPDRVRTQVRCNSCGARGPALQVPWRRRLVFTVQEVQDVADAIKGD